MDTAPSQASGPLDPDKLDVPADASLEEQRPRTMKHGDTFAVYDQQWRHPEPVRAARKASTMPTRAISRTCGWLHRRRAADAAALEPARRQRSADLRSLQSGLSRRRRRGSCLKHNRIHIRRVRVLWDGAASERISIHNYDSEPARLSSA